MAGARAAVAALLAAAALAGCQPGPGPDVPVQLRAMAQVQQRFDTARGPARTDFYVTDWPARPGAAARDSLAAQLRALPPPPGADWALRSVYVYRRGPGLDEQLQLLATQLRGAHAHDVVAFARWTAGRLDMMVAVHDGQVVFDLLRGQAVDPPWDFR